jgi:ribonucleoside-diphosphate reductase alpha chain
MGTPAGTGAASSLATAAAASADIVPASDAKFCSIDNPDCEACQ